VLFRSEVSFQPSRPKKVSEGRVKQERIAHEKNLAPLEEAQINQLLENPSLTFSVKLAKKGGIDVSVKNIKS
jgi:hypothetical protein